MGKKQNEKLDQILSELSEIKEEIRMLQATGPAKEVKTQPRSAPARRSKKKPKPAGAAKSARAAAPTKPVLVQDPPMPKPPGRGVS